MYTKNLKISDLFYVSTVKQIEKKSEEYGNFWKFKYNEIKTTVFSKDKTR